MASGFSKFLLRLLGWKIVGGLPSDQPRYIIAVAPHTSNWDFPLGLLVRSALGVDVKYLAKDSLFRWPFGVLFRWLGGYPVVRSRRTNFVQAVVEIFRSKERFAVAIAPEGTRSKVDQLKTGFYYIAHGAGVPIVLCRFDYRSREVIFDRPFHPTGDFAADKTRIDAFFRKGYGKRPELGYLYQS